jgi:hypothetical protein
VGKTVFLDPDVVSSIKVKRALKSAAGNKNAFVHRILAGIDLNDDLTVTADSQIQTKYGPIRNISVKDAKGNVGHTVAAGFRVK